MDDILLVGGGIGGLATALALGQGGVATQLFEQSPAFTEVGAGIGLGPNAVRRLQGWGVWEALQAKGFVPSQLEVVDAKNGQQLGCLPMAKAFEQRYGAPYLTIQRCIWGIFCRMQKPMPRASTPNGWRLMGKLFGMKAKPWWVQTASAARCVNLHGPLNNC